MVANLTDEQIGAYQVFLNIGLQTKADVCQQNNIYQPKDAFTKCDISGEGSIGTLQLRQVGTVSNQKKSSEKGSLKQKEEKNGT